MDGDEVDVFDSVTWESPSAPYEVEHILPTTGPGFRQSIVGAEEPQSAHDPRWEGHLITIVKDPVKELAETKDAYVSYLVMAKVCSMITPVRSPHIHQRPTSRYSRRKARRLVDGSKTSYFSGITLLRTSQHA